jgi:hypothetical protein
VVHQPDLDDRFTVAAVQPRLLPRQQCRHLDGQAEQYPAPGRPARHPAVDQRDEQEQQHSDEQQVAGQIKPAFFGFVVAGKQPDRGQRHLLKHRHAPYQRG